MTRMKHLWTLLLWKIGWPDRCIECQGAKGGAYGNENIVDGMVICDYCHAEYMRDSQEEKVT